MSVYTKTGDDGTTSLYTGERIDKTSFRVSTYGTIDEFNSALAMARAFTKNEKVKTKIYRLQKLLAFLMADFASLDQKPLITFENIAEIEAEMDEMESALPPLKKFIIPGDSQAGAMLDLARTTARRAERNCLTLAKYETIHEVDRIFLNRVSDYCFLLMRIEDGTNV